jgi:N-acetylglucosamine kinase-like BadF-type ATPase
MTQDEVLEGFRTRGFNPNVMSFEQMRSQLLSEVLPQLKRQVPHEIIFFGASFSVQAYCEPFEVMLAEVIGTNKHHVRVGHDLEAAARSVCQDQAGIACILGTGSNSCLYDGKEILRSRGGHGYLLGDEGSGADMGKRLIKALLDGDLDPDLRDSFLAKQGKDLYALRNGVYHAERPNVHLASFTQFISGHLQHHQIRSIVTDSFDAFLKKTVLRYDGYKELPCYFVGSVASVYQHLLEERCKAHGVKFKGAVSDPIHGLVQYYQRHFPVHAKH